MIGIATSASRSGVTIEDVGIDNTAAALDEPAMRLEIGNSIVRNNNITAYAEGIASTGTGIFETRITENEINSWGSGTNGACISIEDASHVVIADNYIEGGDDGIWIQDTMDRCAIVNNIIHDAGRHGIYHTRPGVSGAMTNNRISGNVIDAPSSDGIKLDHSNGGTPFDNIVEGNEVGGAGGIGINVISHQLIAVHDNLVEGVTGLGISVTWATFASPQTVSVNDNIVRNTDGVLIDGTNITGNLYALKFNDNTISDSTTCEIRDNIFGATIQDNTFRATAFRLLDGDSSVVQNNRFTNCTLNPAPFSPDTGMLIISGSDDVTVQGNVCDGEDTAASQAMIELTGTMARCYVGGNVYAGQDPNSGLGGAYEFGLVIGSSVSDTTLHGNDFSQADTEISDSGTNTVDLHGGLDTLTGGGNADSLHSHKSTHVREIALEGTWTTGTGIFRLPITKACTIVTVRVMCDTAPTGSSAIFDVNKNGTSIYPTSTKPTIADGANDSGNHDPDTTALAAGDYLTIDIDQKGSSVAGANGVLAVEFTVP